MTFVEAAADILDREGRPLHAKEIAEKAVALGLLSHVGKTPVQTMSTQLSAAVLKGKGPFARVRPGVFTLTEWEGKPPGPKPKPPVEKKPAPAVSTPALPKPSVSESAARGSGSRDSDARKPTDAKPSEPGSSASMARNRSKARSEPGPSTSMSPNQSKTHSEPGPSTSVVPSRPKARSEGGMSAAEEETSDGGQKRRKRRRKKAAKGVSSAAPDPVASPPSNERKGDSHLPPAGERRPALNEATASRQTGSIGNESRRRGESDASPGDGERAHGSDVERMPEEISDRAEKLLRRESRPMPTQALLEQLGVSAPNGAVLLEALLASDGLEREKEGRRSRFVKHKSGWGLAAREVSGEIISLENQAAEIRRRLAHLAERQLLKKLRVLPVSAFVRIFIMYLERSGFGSVQPAGHGSIEGIHLSVQDRRRKGRFRTAVILRRESADHLLSEHAVMDLRGALHHFGAVGGMIFTTGRVSDKASEEGRVPNLPPITVMDGETLAREMVRMGIGVKERTVSLPAFDDGLFIKLES